MIMDKLVEFADGASATGTTGTTILGDVVDLGDPRRDIGSGFQAILNLAVSADVTGANTSTLQFAFTTADNAALSTNAEDVFLTPVLDAAAGVPAGTVLAKVVLPMRQYRRFIGIRRIIAGASTTGGTIDAFITLDSTTWQPYPSETGL